MTPAGPLAGDGGAAAIDRILRLVREHLGMEVAFLARIDGDQRTVRAVDADEGAGVLAPATGDVDPLDDTYCKALVEGRIAPVVPDATADPVLAAMEVTDRLGVRAYVGSPVVLTDGSVYGTLCAISHTPQHGLTERDASFVQLIAGLVSERVEDDVRRSVDAEVARRRVGSALQAGDPTMVFQPIVDLRQDRVVGFEALARFASSPTRGPDAWFADASTAGLAVELEVAAVRQALLVLPEAGDAYLALNVSPPVLLSSELGRSLAGAPPGRVVLELTEHELVEDQARTRAVIRRYRRRGIALALDDVGAGYAGLTQILRLGPDIVKLDGALVRGVADDPARRSLVSAAVAFAGATGTELIAEGVEDLAELDVLRRLGVTLAQGFALGHPGPILPATSR